MIFEFRGGKEMLGKLISESEATEEERELIDKSCQAGWKTANRWWKSLAEMPESESEIEDDYNGEFCAFCGEGGEALYECETKGCVYSVHRYVHGSRSPHSTHES